MKSTCLNILFLAAGANAQRVVQASIQHFESKELGPAVPLIKLGLGTPAQNITGIFDTASSDIIVPEAAPFKPDAAADIQLLAGKSFNATLSRGEHFEGDYAKTTVTLDGVEVPDAQVGFASNIQTQANISDLAVVGVGLVAREATANKYNNLPRILNVSGVTNSQAYSVVFNATPLGNGSVFFGGIDRSKFTGDLQQVPLVKDKAGQFSEFLVELSSIALVPAAAPAKVRRSTRQERREQIRRIPVNNNDGKKNELPNQEAPTETRKQEAPKTTSKQAAPKETPKQEAPKLEVPKLEAPKTTSKLAAPKTTSTQAAPKTTSKQAAPKETPKQEAPKKEAPKKDNGGGQPAKLIASTDLGLDQRSAVTLMNTAGGAMALPAAVVAKMAGALGTSFSATNGLGPVDCGRLGGDAALLMRFRNDTVEARVPLSNLRVSAELADPAIAQRGLCEVAVRPVPDGGAEPNVATLPFFAAMYTVFDLGNRSLWFAQARGDPSVSGAQLEEFP
ncbi:putative aspartic-type endopeptidase OPSB [Beauveria bassiana]|uniref:Putative aspartic-type endopeptidase OPSB n=1 Tax=Beauveria bassiana TaxID=176275 RepID=A0A2N6P1H6_BEABA|nr:putative aspartic-type endopeptidase OPSB [Beauveria bassiana]